MRHQGRGDERGGDSFAADHVAVVMCAYEDEAVVVESSKKGLWWLFGVKVSFFKTCFWGKEDHEGLFVGGRGWEDGW